MTQLAAVEADTVSPAARLTGPDASPPRFYDWDAMRIRYVEGVADPRSEWGRVWPSMNQVADHYEMPANRVRERAARDKWLNQRTAFQQQLDADRQRARSELLAKEAVRLDGNALQAAQAGVQLVLARLSELAADQQAAQRLRAAGITDGPAVDSKEMSELAGAVERWQRVGERALGVETLGVAGKRAPREGDASGRVVDSVDAMIESVAEEVRALERGLSIDGELADRPA